MRGIWLKTPAFDVYGHMAFDDAVLSSALGDTLLLRFYEWPGGPRDPRSPHAATFGYFQRYEDGVRQLNERGLSGAIPLARRPTGGGLVLHDSELTFSLVFPWSRLASPSFVYKDMHRGIHLGLKSLGLPSRLWSPGSAAAAAQYAPRNARGESRPQAAPGVDCFAGPSPMDLVHEDGRKFLGGALRRRQGMGLYQGALRPEGFGVERDWLRRAILDGLSLEWKASFMPQDADDPSLSAAERLREERYATDNWNHRR